MSHMIDQSTGRAAMAYRLTDVNALSFENQGFHRADGSPWHGLGYVIEEGDDIDTIRAKAGLDWDVKRANVAYDFIGPDGVVNKAVKNRSVLYRSDTGADLGIVSKTGYKIHQPKEIMDFFGAVAMAGKFQIETAGALSDGKRIWALARVGEGANIVGQDKVYPYLLLATSYDGTMTTIARFTNIRVVCHNTITMALELPATANRDSRIVTSLKLPHSVNFDPEMIRQQLGIVHGAFDQFLAETRKLASIEVNDELARAVTANIMADFAPAAKPGQVVDITKSRGFQTVMSLFKEDSIDNQLSGGPNAWTLLNAFTGFVDHKRGRTRNTGLEQAWFGTGEAIKNAAKEKLLALV